MKNKKESFFWTSYSDLMTSLFFVMLVLFVLVIVLLHNKMVDIEKGKVEIEIELEKIKELVTSVEKIDTIYFKYDIGFKRHTLKSIKVSFALGQSDINNISQQDRDRLCAAGRSIKEFVQDAVKIDKNVKYLLIVEGQSSRDKFSRNYELSYERALALVKYWESNEISFNDEHCEIIISGSGDGSIFKHGNQWLFREKNEEQNQRFVIHVIPKVGELK